MKQINKDNDKTEIWDKIGNTIILVVVAIPFVLNWLITSPGNCIVFGLIAIYGLFVNVESYYAALLSSPVNFVVKPFIQTDVPFVSLNSILFTFTFAIAFLFALGIQVLQTHGIRKGDLAIKKAKYAEIEKERVPEAQPNQLDIAESLRKQIKTHGKTSYIILGVLVVSGWVIDFGMSAANLQLTELNSFGELFVKLVGCVFAMFGTEALAHFCIVSWEDGKETQRIKRATKVIR